MKIKTSELSGVALDWAVEYALLSRVANLEMRYSVASMHQRTTGVGYSSNWAISGPVIEREKISVGYERFGSPGGGMWDAVKKVSEADGLWLEFGSTPLEAAMRVLVASEIGNQVDVPDELL
jgi:hypothetical protein